RILAGNGDLSLTGAGTVQGAGLGDDPALQRNGGGFMDLAAGALLEVASQGNLDTRDAVLRVTNTGTEGETNAVASLESVEGTLSLGQVDVATQGMGGAIVGALGSA